MEIKSHSNTNNKIFFKPAAPINRAEYQRYTLLDNIIQVFSSPVEVSESTSPKASRNSAGSVLKKIIKVTLGVSIFTGVIYTISKSYRSKTMFGENETELSTSNIDYLLMSGSHSATVSSKVEGAVRHVRHINAKKNHPYIYYYNKNQSRECLETKLLTKCKKEHNRRERTGRHYTSLVLNVGYMPCLCPPPDNKIVNIIPPQLNYTYTGQQSKECKSKDIIKSCNEHHHYLKKTKGRYYKELMFIIKNTMCYCPPLKSLLVNIIPPKLTTDKKMLSDEFITNKSIEMAGGYPVGELYIINRKTKRISFKNEKRPDEEHHVDMVTIKKMYDFSCLTESENITFSKALNIIGETLKSPIDMLAIESLKIHYFNTLHLGCPSKKTINRVNEIAIVCDSVLNFFMQLLPESKSVIITKNIISPLLIAISQELDNKPLNLELLDEINSNALFVFQDYIRSLNEVRVNKIKSMNEREIEKHTEDDFNKKFSVKSKGLCIRYDNMDYTLLFDSEKRPYIYIDNKKVFVGYHIDGNKWQPLSDDYIHYYSEENIDNAKQYAINDLEDDIAYNIEDIKDSDELEFFKLMHYFNVQRIFIAENIIPVYKFRWKLDEFIYMTAKIDLPKKIIIETPFGFVFDKDSTGVSHILGMYIEHNLHGRRMTEINRFSKIHDNKFSFNRNNEPHIKYKNNYYPVRLYDEDNKYSIYSQDYNELTYIKMKDSVFDFHEDTDFHHLDFFKEDVFYDVKIKDGYFDFMLNSNNMMPIKSDQHNAGYIYLQTYIDLLNNGRVLSKDLTDLQKVDSLIYKDKISGADVLNVNDRLYVITAHSDSDGIISVKPKGNADNDIDIYRYDDLLIQVKKEKFQNEYMKLVNCKSKRELTDYSCVPIYISSSLKSKLDNNLSGGHSISVNDVRIKVFDDLPGFFYRKNTVYYYYEKKLFQVKFIPKNTEGNYLPHDLVNVYTKSIFTRKRKITSFVFERKNNRIELKEPDVFLAENTGNDRVDMYFLLESKKYYNVPNVFEINTAITEVNKSNKLVIIQPPEPPDINLSYEDMMRYCHEAFYNNNDKIRFTLLKMDDVTVDNDFHLWASKIKTELHLKYAREVLDKSISLLKNPSLDLTEYLKSILRTDSKEITEQFSECLMQAFRLTRSKLDSKFIYLVSAVKEPYEAPSGINGELQSSIHYKKVLDNVSARTGTFAFASKIKNARIYVCTDKFYFIDPTHPDNELHQPNELDLAETLIHEASHAGYGTEDYYYMSHAFDGLLKPLITSRSQFINKISSLKENNYNNLIKAVVKYIETISIYERWKVRLLINREMLSFFLDKDVGAMANIYLNNADFLTKISKDIYHLDTVDKGALHYYSHFLNMVNVMPIPVMNILGHPDDESIIDSEFASFPESAESDRSLYDIDEGESADTDEIVNSQSS